MPGFEQNQSTNLKVKNVSRLDTERSEMLNSDSTQHVKTSLNDSFSIAACKRCYTAALCQFSIGIRT